jgi:hypothetical protein
MESFQADLGAVEELMPQKDEKECSLQDGWVEGVQGTSDRGAASAQRSEAQEVVKGGRYRF